jgi:hypothetical protein
VTCLPAIESGQRCVERRYCLPLGPRRASRDHESGLDALPFGAEHSTLVSLNANEESPNNPPVPPISLIHDVDGFREPR